MTDFVIGDIVKYRRANKCGFGCIRDVTPKKLKIYDFDESEHVIVSKLCAEILPPILLDKERYSKLARYEITLQDIVKDNVWQNIVNVDDYRITLEDLLCVLKKIVSCDIDENRFMQEWFCMFDEAVENISKNEKENRFYDRTVVMEDVFVNFMYWTYYGVGINFELLIDEIETFSEDENKPLKERRFPESAKLSLIRLLNDDVNLNNASEDEILLYKQFAVEFCENEDIDGLSAVGYGCYGGNRAFECDWKKSEECILKLFNLVGDEQSKSFYANTLGYIYYYGRTTNGVPDYEKAYKYFSFAAFNGVYEAEYKIADMYKNGYGVIKSKKTAENIVNRLYYENLKYIQNGVFDSKFADIAFRVGNLYKDDENIYDSDFEKMLDLYYQARFAIRMRINETNHYGDEKVAGAIDEALEETKKIIGFKPEKKVVWYSLHSLFYDYLSDGGKLDIKSKEMANGKYKLVFKPHKGHGDKKAKRLFITIPELDMCGLYDSFTVNVICEDEYSFAFAFQDTVTVDGMDDEGFYFDGAPYILFRDCAFEIKKPKNDDKPHRFVSVQFQAGGHFYDYLCDDESIKVGDKVAVSAGGEDKTVTVVKVFEKTESETALPFKAYKTIK